MLGVYTILEAGRAGLGLDPDARARRASRSRCSPPSSRARRGSANPLMPLRLFRSRNVAGANVVQALLVAGMFGMFFLGALYLQRDARLRRRSRSASPSCPRRLVMGTLSLGFAERLIMRFGAARRR